MRHFLLAPLLLPLLLLALATAVHAQANTAGLTCSPPTANTDGSLLTAAQKPLTFKFFEGTTSGTYPNVSPAQTSCAFTFTGLAAGTHFFVATAIDKLGTSSVQTAPVSKQVVNPTPQPPSMLTVGADTFAYQIVQTDNQVTLLAMGTAPAGTACDTNQSVTDAAHGTAYLIPYTAVILPNGMRNTKRRTVFAACG
jgi:hypothetical protein